MKNTKEEDNKNQTVWWMFLLSVILITLFIRTFVLQAFIIPSGSMKPNLQIGDFILVSKSAYGYTRYSLPLDSLLQFEGSILTKEPKRGDVVVFRNPLNQSKDYIKRVIGMPGDNIQVVHGQLFINGKPIKKELVNDEQELGFKVDGKLYKEYLPNGKTYYVIDSIEDGYADNTRVYHVPADSYFMMGDNRDNSQDSRFLNKLGYVNKSYLIGKAKNVVFSFDLQHGFWKFWYWPLSIRYKRTFSSIK